MIYLGVFLSSISGLAGFLLLRRLRLACATVRSATTVAGHPSPLLDLLRRTLIDWIDRDLLSDAGPRGLRDVPLKSRQSYDPSDVTELLRAIASKAESRGVQDMVDTIRYLFILQHSLEMTAADFEACIWEVVERLKNADYQGSRIKEVIIPRAGEIFDRVTMSLTLGLGSTVDQPMGVALKDERNVLVIKAEVLCR